MGRAKTKVAEDTAAEGDALEAYRREKISRRKLIDLAASLGVDFSEVETVILNLGLDHEDEAEPLMPSA